MLLDRFFFLLETKTECMQFLLAEMYGFLKCQHMICFFSPSVGGAFLLLLCACGVFTYLLCTERHPWDGPNEGVFLISCIFGPGMICFLMIALCCLLCINGTSKNRLQEPLQTKMDSEKQEYQDIL